MEFDVQENKIAYIVDGRELAWVTFPQIKPGVVEIDHTFVAPSLRGQGMAGRMMERVAEALRKSGRKAHLSCTYAKQWFERNPQQQDLLDF